MTNQGIRTVILIGFLLLAVSCQTEISTSGMTTAVTPNVRLAEQTAGSTTVIEGASTMAPTETTAPAETATPAAPPTPVAPPAEDTPEFKYEAIAGVLPFQLIYSDYQALEDLMGDSFIIGYWGSEDQTMSPSEAIEQFRSNLLPDPTTFRFTRNLDYFPELGEFDPTKAFGYQVKVVDLVYSEGWGADGQGAAILTIGLTPDGQYWPGMIYAPAGFEDRPPQDGVITYVNEHAGYAFDYPAGWVVQGSPSPGSYNYVIILKSFKLIRGSGPVADDQVKLDFETCNSAECNTLQAMEERIDENVAAGMLEILSEEEWTLDSGIPTIRRRVVGPMGIESALLFTEINGQSLSVSGFGDLSAFDEIVRTLRPAQGQATQGGLYARLEIPQSLPSGEPVKMQFFLVNDSDEALYVLNWFTPLEGLGGDIFRVRRDGERVPYQGPLAERAEPTPEAYTLIEAGDIAWAEVELNWAYDFSVPGNYTIEFNSPGISHIAKSEADMASTYDELGPIEIPSNEVSVTIESDDRSSADMEAAREVLARYFSLLSEGQYADAVVLYGGGYENLRDSNPTADPDDLAALLEQGCTVNGLRCLPARTIMAMGAGAPDTYAFEVQFQEPDGSMFAFKPGVDWAEDTFPKSLFEFMVVREGDNFVVQDLPVYVP